MRKAHHPLHSESVGAHTKVRTPGSVGYGHCDSATGAEGDKYTIGLGLVVCDNRYLKVVAECYGWTEALFNATKSDTWWAVSSLPQSAMQLGPRHAWGHMQACRRPVH